MKISATSKVVDQTENLILTYQVQGANVTGAFVGGPVSTSVTVTPIKLRTFTVSSTQLAQGQTIQISCCQTDNQGHSKGTFSITPRPEGVSTQITE